MKKVIYITPLIEQRTKKQISSLKKFTNEIILIYGRKNKIFAENTMKLCDSFQYKFSSNPQNPFSLEMKRSLKSIIKKFTSKEISAIFVRDILLYTAIIGDLRKKFPKSKIVLDIADNYEYLAEDIYPKNSLGKFILKKVVINGYKKVLDTDSLFVVCNENKERISKTYNLKKENIFVIENLPDFTLNLETKKKFGKNKIIYVGYIDNRIRNLKEVFYALKGTNWKLDIYGVNTDSSSYKNLLELKKDIDNTNQINFFNPVGHDKYFDILKNYDLGLIPHMDINTVKYTLPNKLYDYILAGVPVLSRSTSILNNYLSKHNVGFIYNDQNTLTDLLKSIQIQELEEKKQACLTHKKYIHWSQYESFFKKILSK